MITESITFKKDAHYIRAHTMLPTCYYFMIAKMTRKDVVFKSAFPIKNNHCTKTLMQTIYTVIYSRTNIL